MLLEKAEKWTWQSKQHKKKPLGEIPAKTFFCPSPPISLISKLIIELFSFVTVISRYRMIQEVSPTARNITLDRLRPNTEYILRIFPIFQNEEFLESAPSHSIRFISPHDGTYLKHFNVFPMWYFTRCTLNWKRGVKVLSDHKKWMRWGERNSIDWELGGRKGKEQEEGSVSEVVIPETQLIQLPSSLYQKKEIQDDKTLLWKQNPIKKDPRAFTSLSPSPIFQLGSLK